MRPSFLSYLDELRALRCMPARPSASTLVTPHYPLGLTDTTGGSSQFGWLQGYSSAMDVALAELLTANHDSVHPKLDNCMQGAV
jgi:hypothetical protein